MVNLVKVKLLKDFPREGWKRGEICNIKKKEAIIWGEEGVVEIIKKDKKKSTKKIKTKKEGASLKPKQNQESKERKKKEDKKQVVKEILNKEKGDQELENYKKGEINWISDDYWNSWERVKGHTKKIWNHNKLFDSEPTKWFFLSHDKDTIRGKPQLVEPVQKKITLVRKAVKKEDEMKLDDAGVKMVKTGEKIEKQYFYLFDEKFDKRYDGFQKDAFSLYFWIYKIVSEDGKEYNIFTQKKLPNCTCNFKGMLVELDDFAEMSKTLKMKSVTGLFFSKEFEADIKIISKEQLIKFTKERKLTETDWLNFLAYNPLGNFNRFPDDIEKLNSAHVLSGKLHNYPLHRFIFGVPGTKKTMGYIETLAYKFEEEPTICEGGVSRLKGLEPSYKEKPADIGYLAKMERFAFIDEIGKMVEKMSEKEHRAPDNALGSLNFLLEHKKRQGLSGNDNVEVMASGKNLFLANPMINRSNIYEHVGLIDPSTMSRMLIWVQDNEETTFALSEKSIEDVPRRVTQDYELKKNQGVLIENEKGSIVLSKCPRKYIVENIDLSRNEFLTLFDTCYSFICELDKSEVEKIVTGTTQLAKEPMKSSVWKPRAYHHTYLVIDGLVKHRCLFKDYDSTFTPKQEDYDLAERILVRMVKGWDTNLSPKGEFNGF